MKINTQTNAYTDPTRYLRTLGDRLRYCRQQLGLTQDQLAKAAGTNQSVIQKIENGKSLRPRVLANIAQAVHVEESWLLFGEGAGIPLSDKAVQLAQMWDNLDERDQYETMRDIEKRFGGVQFKHKRKE